MARGDIVTVDLPVPLNYPGREQTGYRPAIVVQADRSGDDLPTTMIIPMTSNLAAMRFPHTFCVDPSPQNGLTRPSVLLVFQLRAIDKARLGKNIGHLEQHHLRRLESEIKLLLSL